MLLPLPAAMLRALLGEMAALVLGSQRVVPERLQAQNFQFQFTDLGVALSDILNRNRP
jgi:NAD dependent epimerase/dehydratase family enzyme